MAVNYTPTDPTPGAPRTDEPQRWIDYADTIADVDSRLDTLEAGGGGGGDSVGPIVTRQIGLGTDTTTSTSLEQWGTEQVVFDNAWFPAGALTIEARLTGDAADVDTNELVQVGLRISVDGGSTWTVGDKGPAHGSTRATTTDDRIPLAAQQLLAGVTPTADIIVQATIQTFNGAGSASFNNGLIIATCRPTSIYDTAANP